MMSTVKVYAVLTAKQGRTLELGDLLREMASLSRLEEGNLRYDLWQDSENPARFLLDELYRDQISAAAHKASPHFQNYLARVGDLADRLPLTVTAVDVA
jgi:quinol monooxygenase YgiN